jgi:hypothetical protein
MAHLGGAFVPAEAAVLIGKVDRIYLQTRVKEVIFPDGHY